MAVMIVAMHTGACPELVNPWFRIAVPLFFIISSFFFFKKVNATDESGRKEVLKHYLGRVIKLYLFWMVLQFPVNLVLSWNSLMADGLLLMPLYLCRKVLFSGMFGASWFLLALVYGVPVVFFLSKYLKNKYIILLTSLLNAIVILQCSYANLSDAAIRVREMSSQILGCNLEFSFIVALLWIGIGKFFADDICKIKVSNLLLIVLVSLSCVLLYVENRLVDDYNLAVRHDAYFMLMPLCSLLFLLLSRLRINFKYAYQLRKLSTILFCMHFTLNKCLALFFSKVIHCDIPGYLTFVFVLLTCILTGQLILYILRTHEEMKLLRYAC